MLGFAVNFGASMAWSAASGASSSAASERFVMAGLFSLKRWGNHNPPHSATPAGLSGRSKFA
jgi:hypothetical protein